MDLTLTIHQKTMRLCVDGTRHCVSWEDNNDLLEKFFPAVDDLLTTHGAALADVTQVHLVTDVPQGYTTARIARVIVRTLRFALCVEGSETEEKEVHT